MTIKNIISNISQQSDDLVIYAKKENGKFQSHSEAMAIYISDDDIELPTPEVAKKYCPGFDYFLEISIIKHLLEDMHNVPEYKTEEQRVQRIIYYAENDA